MDISSSWPHLFFSLHRNDPPGQSTSIATQELLRLTEANPEGLPAIDPVKDLHLKDIDLVEKFQRLSGLNSIVEQFGCLNCTNFMDHVSSFCHLQNWSTYLPAIDPIKDLLLKDIDLV